MSYGSILGVIPLWKLTARLPKYMIDLQIATTSRTLTTFSPEQKTQLVQNQSQFQDHLVIHFNHFLFLPGQIPPSPKLVKHLLCFRKALRNRMAARIVVTGRTVPARSGETLAPETRRHGGSYPFCCYWLSINRDPYNIMDCFNPYITGCIIRYIIYIYIWSSPPWFPPTPPPQRGDTSHICSHV